MYIYIRNSYINIYNMYKHADISLLSKIIYMYLSIRLTYPRDIMRQ